MSYKTVSVEIQGVSPLIMHSGALADPLCEWNIAKKPILGKPAKKRTEDDLIELARIEFMGSLYMGPNGPVIPGVNLEALIVEASKKTREGKLSKSSIIVDGDWPLIYDGPKDADALWADKRFVNSVSAKVNNARVMRTRPIFPADWQLKFEVMYLPSVVSAASIRTWLDTAGSLCGLGDWRPRYGRFVVTAFE